MPKSSTFVRLALIVPTMVGVIALAACSSTPAPSSSSNSSTSAEIGTKTPGTLALAADFTASPNQFISNGKNDGLNVALCGQLAKELGVTITWTNLGFDSLIPGLQAGRYDALCTSIFITTAREQVMNMVPYVKWGDTLGILKKNKSGYKAAKAGDFSQLADKTVGTPSGGAEVAQLQAANTKLSSPMKIVQFESNVQVYQALKNGSVDAIYLNDPQFAFQNKLENDAFSPIFTGNEGNSLALATLKPNTKLATSFEKALKAMKSDGSYAKILKEWGVEGVTDFSMNPVASK